MEQPSAPSTRISLRQAICIGCLAILLLTQFALPTLLLFKPRPHFAGWQMYSSTKPDIQLALVATDGAVTPLALQGYIGRNRREIDFASHLPPLVCERNPTISAVQVTMGEQQWIFQCN